MLNVKHLRLQDLYQIPTNLLVAQIAGAIPILVGSLVLVGWCFDIELLKRGFPGSPATMKVNTALCFVLSGVSLWLFSTKAKVAIDDREQEVRSQEKRTIPNYPYSSTPQFLYSSNARFCAMAVTVIAVLTLSEYLFGWQLGIDELLLPDTLTTMATLHPGRMGANTATNFMLVSVALQILIEQKNHRSYWYTQILALLATLISFQALMGYAYKVKVLYGLAPYTTSMALHTAVLFSLLSIGILWVRAEQGLMKVVTSDTYGGLLARRLLVAAIAVPFILGWLIVEGQRSGEYDPAFAISVFAIVLIVIFAVLVWQSAAVIENLSSQRDRAQETVRAYQDKLASFVDANVIGILFGNIDGIVEQANDAFLRMIGYTREDLLSGKISWKDITPIEHLYLDQQGILEAKENSSGVCTPYEKEYIRRDGSRISVLVGYALLGEQREESAAFILDLSDRKQAQAEQQKAEARVLQLNKDLQHRVQELQTLLDVIPVGIAIAEDAECQTIKVNPAFAKQLGISPKINDFLNVPAQARHTHYKAYREGKELSAAELPMQFSAAQGVEVLDFEMDILHESGKTVNLLVYVAPLFDEEGKTRGSVGAFLDISDRKQAAAVLHNQQKWLENVLNLMPKPLLFIEPGTARVTFANRSADELAGGEFPKDVPAAKYHTAYHYTDAAGNSIPNEQMPGVRVARGERLDGLEIDWHTKNGVRSLLIFADTLPAMHGHPATCILVFQDISNLKQVEKALSLGYKRLQLLFDTASNLLSSQHPVALIDSVFQKLKEQIGLDVYFNYLCHDSQVMRLESYSGISPELAKNIEWLKFGEAVCGTVAQERCVMAVENVQQSTDPKTELIRSLGINTYYCYPLLAQEKLLGTLSFGSCTLLSFTENQKGMIQAVCDQIALAMERASLIASLQQQTEQLREANRMKDEFLAILSHELRSPLNAILGWAQLLHSRKLNETQMARAAETIERNAKAQTQLVEDLLDISRMIRGKLRLNVRTCALVPMIESAIETVSLAAQVKKIDVRFSLVPPSEPSNLDEPPQLLLTQATESSLLSKTKNLNYKFLVSGDIDRLQQVIWNLLSNAIKFTPDGGKVDMKLEKIVVNHQKLLSNSEELAIASYAQIQVTDTGIGISPDFLPYVFERFRQADSSSTRSYGGLGLGLAIVRHLVELHGGTIHVDSAGEGKGATFTVNLPLLKNQQLTVFPPLSDSPPPSPPLSPSLLNIRVLVVDDEADSREFITTVLQQCQAEVQAVASVPEALQAIEQWKPDVLVSDIGIPYEDGYSLIRKLRSQPPEQGGKIPAAALTAYARAEDRMRAIQEGYQMHLPKPIEPAELATVVASLVGRVS